MSKTKIHIKHIKTCSGGSHCFRVSLDIFSVQANTGPKWAEKSEIAFWRGRDSRQERLALAELSRKRPDMVDAALTFMFFFPKNEEKYGPTVKPVSFFDFFKVDTDCITRLEVMILL